MQEQIKYVGPNEITGVVILDEKTPKGGEMVKVLYKDERLPSETMPKTAFEVLVSDEPRDWNHVRETRYKKLILEITELFLEHGVLYSDNSHVLDTVKKKVEAAYDRATNYLWTKDDPQFVPGYHPLAFRSILDADKILRSIKDEPKPEEPKS